MRKKIPNKGERSEREMQDSGNENYWWLLATVFIAVLIGFIMVSCESDTLNVNGPTEEGLPATLKIDVNVSESATLQTRALNTTAIANLHILVYNSTGVLIGQSYATTTSSITVKTRSASNCRVYAIANTGNANLFTGKAMTETNLQAMITAGLTAWNELTSASYLVMTGSKTGVNIAAGAGNTISGLSVTRLAAQVTLNVATTQTDIKIKSYQICSLPNQAYYMARPTTTESNANDTGNTAAGTDAVQPGTAAHWIKSSSIAVDAMTLNTVFYMYENRRGVKTNITAQGNKTTANAPANATYVVINGEAGGYNATWTIYLGANNTSNFNIKRNCNYTYNILLKEGSIADTRVVVDEKVFSTVTGTVSNCYIVPPGTAVTIPVIRANQSTIAIGGVTTQIGAGTVWEAEIVWQSSPFLIYLSRSARTGTGPNGRFKVVATDATKQGNAVVAIRDKSTKEIVWSWHIWVMSGVINKEVYGTTSLMDRALGATSMIAGDLGTCGLAYQWGRKDPFPCNGQDGGSWTVANSDPIRVYNSVGEELSVKIEAFVPVVPNNLTNATRNPLCFYTSVVDYGYDWFADGTSGRSHNDNLWGGINTTNPAGKTVFDPCPEGWRVPPYKNGVSPFSSIIMKSTATYGYYFASSGGGSGHYWSAAASRSYTNGLPSNDLVNRSSACWSASPSGAGNSGGKDFYFYKDHLAPEHNLARANGCTIRCTPDN